MELWDAYLADETLAGVDLVRGEAIPEGLHHVVAEVFVIHEDGSILLMQRDFNKPTYPGFWEPGAGGSVLKGEGFLEGAKRELQEETGIIAEELKLIYSSIGHDRIHKGYLCFTDIAKDGIILQEGETIDYKWVSKEEFLKIYESEKFPKTLRERLSGFVNRVLDGRRL